MKAEWAWETSRSKGTLIGDSFTTVLLGHGLSNSDLLVRESIQNSSDAARKSGSNRPRVVFRRELVTGTAKQQLIKTLAFEEAFIPRLGELKLPEENALISIADPGKPIGIVYVEDFGTPGLSGDPDDDSSDFYRMLFSLGDADKAEALDMEGSGGSYGYGKGAYSLSSKLSMLIAHTVIDPHLDPLGVGERAIGCAYLRKHEIGGSRFSGRAWLGELRPAHQDAGALVDEHARSFAANLGFSPRASDKFGTSILIVDTDLSMVEIRRAVETWYWPRLIDQEIEILLFDRGQEIEPPDPHGRDDLRPYIEAYELAVGRNARVGSSQGADKLPKISRTQLGTWGCVMLGNRLPADSDDELEVQDVPISRIALIRGPKMVVDYHQPWGSQGQYAAAFLADSEVDQTLKLSEPPAHHQWDYQNERRLNESRRRLVKGLLRSLGAEVRAFLRAAAPAPKRDSSRFQELDSRLSRTLRPPARRGGGSHPHSMDPISISRIQNERETLAGERARVSGSFEVELTPAADIDTIKVHVSVQCLPVEEDGIATKEPVAVRLKAIRADEARNSSSGTMVCRLRKGVKAKFAYRSEPYDRDWSVKEVFSVEEVAA